MLQEHAYIHYYMFLVHIMISKRIKEGKQFHYVSSVFSAKTSLSEKREKNN